MGTGGDGGGLMSSRASATFSKGRRSEGNQRLEDRLAALPVVRVALDEPRDSSPARRGRIVARATRSAPGHGAGPFGRSTRASSTRHPGRGDRRLGYGGRQAHERGVAVAHRPRDARVIEEFLVAGRRAPSGAPRTHGTPRAMSAASRSKSSFPWAASERAAAILTRSLLRVPSKAPARVCQSLRVDDPAAKISSARRSTCSSGGRRTRAGMRRSRPRRTSVSNAPTTTAGSSFPEDLRPTRLGAREVEFEGRSESSVTVGTTDRLSSAEADADRIVISGNKPREREKDDDRRYRDTRGDSTCVVPAASRAPAVRA